jgi:hypothetical protein
MQLRASMSHRVLWLEGRATHLEEAHCWRAAARQCSRKAAAAKRCSLAPAAAAGTTTCTAPAVLRLCSSIAKEEAQALCTHTIVRLGSRSLDAVSERTRCTTEAPLHGHASPFPWASSPRHSRGWRAYRSKTLRRCIFLLLPSPHTAVVRSARRCPWTADV